MIVFFLLWGCGGGGWGGGGNTARDEVDGMRDVQMVGEREGHHAELYDS